MCNCAKSSCWTGVLEHLEAELRRQVFVLIFSFVLLCLFCLTLPELLGAAKRVNVNIQDADG